MVKSDKDDKLVSEFFRLVCETLDATERFLSRDDLAPGSEALRKAAINGLSGLRGEVSLAESLILEDVEALGQATQALQIAGSVGILSAQVAQTEAAKTPEATAA